MWLVLVQGYPFGFKAGEKEMWRGKWVGKTNPNCSKMVVIKMVSYHPICITSLSKKHTFELIIGWKHFCSLPCSQAWHVTKFWTMRYKWKMMWNFLETAERRLTHLENTPLTFFPSSFLHSGHLPWGQEFQQPSWTRRWPWEQKPSTGRWNRMAEPRSLMTIEPP